MAKISLCMIVGNVAEYIPRCLESFEPIIDELCIVRAIGSQKPDETVELAESFCQKRDIAFKFAEYHNATCHEDWPHVDNFAAARNLSFSLANGDYCFWCDSDDILKTGAEQIRQHANAGGYVGYMFPYDVFGKGVVVMRERLLLREAGKWVDAVHEHFQFKMASAMVATDEGVVIQHLPKLSKTGSNDRNLRILESIPESEMTTGLRYHLFNELTGMNRTVEAVAVAEKLLTGGDIGKDERYDLLLSLVLLTPDVNQRNDLLHEAHKTDPERREALGTLTTNAIDRGNYPAALAYARQMAATVAPANQCWNSRVSFYGYVGDDIYQQALRVNGLRKEANKVRLDSLDRHGGPRIALLHATRGRAQKAAKCRKHWHDLAAQPGRIEHIFAIDEDDKESAPLKRFHHIVVPSGGGCVRAWNYAADATEAPIIIQLSDDWLPVAEWDNLIVDRIGDATKPSVLAISDGIRTDDLLCMAICTRAYLSTDYFLFHPWFTGVYSDNWFTEKAYERGAVIQARDIVFQHDHPIAGAPMDATYTAQNAPERYAEGRAVLNRLQAGTDWSSVPGFFNYWKFYERIALGLKDGDTVAEVGTWLGRSIIFLAQELKRQGKRVKLIAVDTFKGEANQPAHYEVVNQAGGSIRQMFESNLARCGVADMVEIIEGDSAESAAKISDGSLAFCFIDAAHDYESVKRDVCSWKSKLKAGAFFAGHDIACADVERAVRDSVGEFAKLGPVWATQIK